LVESGSAKNERKSATLLAAIALPAVWLSLVQLGTITQLYGYPKCDWILASGYRGCD
jgi:hypothetical protein